MSPLKQTYEGVEITYGCSDLAAAEFHARFELPQGTPHVVHGFSEEEVLKLAHEAIRNYQQQ